MRAFRLFLIVLTTAVLFAAPGAAFSAPGVPGCPSAFCLFLPGLTQTDSGRVEAVNAYNAAFGPVPPANWSGSIASCSPGDTSPAFKDAVLARINYYRAAAGIPLVQGLRAEYNAKAQAAALIMAAKGDLSHYPPNTWPCYTQLGYDGAGSSNLSLGNNGPDAIKSYIVDSGNYDTLGHRRWILYPQTQWMGTGDVFGSDWFRISNSLVIWDEHTWEARPATRYPYVAWPPPGYVPYQVVPPVWSFAVAGADFTAAAVTMTPSGGAPQVMTVTKLEPNYGENAISWKGCESCTAWPLPAADQKIHVKVSGVLSGGVTKSYDYDVIIIDTTK